MGKPTPQDARLEHQRAAGDFSALSREGLSREDLSRSGSPRGLPRGRLMGLDVSPNHIGVAISYEGSARTPAARAPAALPIETIARRRFSEDMAALREIIAAHQIAGIIIGLPLQMDGREGRRAQSVRDFSRLLGEAIPLPFAFWDERLSTKQALALPLSKKARRKTDALAAAIILQAALERLA